MRSVVFSGIFLPFPLSCVPCTAVASQGAAGVGAVALLNVLMFLKVRMQCPWFGPSETNALLRCMPAVILPAKKIVLIYE